MKTNLLFFVSISLLLLVSNAVGAESRTWTAGTYKVKAEFVSFDETEKTVKLKTNDGKNVTVSLDKLSKADKQFVQKLSDKRNNDDNPFKVEKEDNPFKTESLGNSAIDKSSVRSVDELNKLANLPLDVLLAKAEKNDPDAQLELAEGRNKGEWYQKGSKHADSGSVAGIICKGYCYLDNYFTNKDQTEKLKALELLQKAAETGDPRGQLSLSDALESVAYIEDREEEYDRTEKLNWIKKAAEQGYVIAQYRLGRSSDSETEMVKWYRKAAEQGYVDAQFALGWCYNNGKGVSWDIIEAAKWYRKAAEQGDLEAQKELGVCYETGRGVSQNKAEAIKWYKKAAEQGHKDALFRIGFCYYYGDESVTQNRTEAVKWYKKAAEQGEVVAQYLLGCCYKDGDGVSQNYTEAFKWFQKSAEQGDIGSQNKLGEFYRDGKGVDKDITQAKKWFQKAYEYYDQSARAGFADAQYKLGVYYLNGNGVDKDITQAKEWFQKAAKNNYQEAIDILKKLESNEK